jgi:hypothetical protein
MGRKRCPTAREWPSNVGSKGRKASTPNQTEPHVEQVIKGNESEDVYVRTVKTDLPTLAKRLQLKSRSGRTQKGQALRPYSFAMYGIHPKEDPVYSIVLRSRKMNIAERSNLSVCSPHQEAVRPDVPTGRMAQEAKASL